jgi:ribulose-5-phosphate 4-epimerase/fuculose-1-phosphate aldolase
VPKSEDQHRKDILDVGKLAYQKGWAAANNGNISVRLGSLWASQTPLLGLCHSRTHSVQWGPKDELVEDTLAWPVVVCIGARVRLRCLAESPFDGKRTAEVVCGNQLIKKS